MKYEREAHEEEIKNLQALDMAEMEAMHPEDCQCERCVEDERLLNEILMEGDRLEAESDDKAFGAYLERRAERPERFGYDM